LIYWEESNPEANTSINCGICGRAAWTAIAQRGLL
jgi:hypothetical protein